MYRSFMSQLRTHSSELLCILRTIYVWTVTIAGLFLAYLFAVILFPLLKAFYDPDKIYSLWAKSILRACGINMLLKGQKRLYEEGPFILASNHESILDMPILQAMVPTRIHLIWIAKKSLFSIPILGGIMRAASYIPVDRSFGAQAYKSVYKGIKEAGTKKCAFIIFPEGTRNRGSKELLPFKEGAALLALRTKVPIQTVTIQGSAKIVPVQEGRWMQRAFSGNVNITIHPCIHPKEYENKSAAELSNLLRQTIASAMLPEESTAENMGKSTKNEYA